MLSIVNLNNDLDDIYDLKIPNNDYCSSTISLLLTFFIRNTNSSYTRI